jgi:hypothetical protein
VHPPSLPPLPSGLEIELRLRTEVALCTFSLEDGELGWEGLALPAGAVLLVSAGQDWGAFSREAGLEGSPPAQA